MMDHNIEDWSALSYVEDMADHCDDEVDQICQIMSEPGTLEEIAKKLIQFFKEKYDEEVLESAGHMFWRCILKLQNANEGISTPKMLGLIYGLGATSGDLNMNITRAAEQNNVCRATISAWATRWRDELDLPVNIHSKSDAARDSYRRVQTEDHWARRSAGRAYQQSQKNKEKKK